jgi:hypothetical protein
LGAQQARVRDDVSDKVNVIEGNIINISVRRVISLQSLFEYLCSDAVLATHPPAQSILFRMNGGNHTLIFTDGR